MMETADQKPQSIAFTATPEELVEIVIQEYDKKKGQGILHLTIRSKKGEDEETIFWEDMFWNIYNNYHTVLKQMQMLQDTIKEITDAVDAKDKKTLEKIMTKYVLHFSTIDTRKHPQQLRRALVEGRRKMLNFYDQAGNFFKDKFEVRGIEQKVALALVLSKTERKEVEDSIKNNGKFSIDVPISSTTYTGFDTLYRQQTTSVVSIVDSALSIFKTFIT